LARAVEPFCRRVSIADPSGNEIVPALHLLREDREAFYLFVCNTAHEASQLTPDVNDPMVRDRRAGFPDVRIRGFAACKGEPVELDPQTGRAFAADAARSRNGWEIRTSLPRIGSRLFVIPKAAGGKKLERRKPLAEAGRTPIGGEKWDIALSEDNVLVLDRPRYRIKGGRWQGPDEVLRVDGAVRDALGVPRRGGGMMQPWARQKPKTPKRIVVTLAYSFKVSHLPGGALHIALERPETFRISVNGQPLSRDSVCGWWCDRSLRKIAVDPSLLRLGDNEIVMECDYDEMHSGLEIAYLLGAFGTCIKGTEVEMTAAPGTLRLGDWVEQGLTFYSGAVTYRQTVTPGLGAGERLFVSVPEYRGAAVRVLVNGRSAGVIGWEPNEVDITELLSGGAVELGIEVISHRRNSHGPLHLHEKWPHWHGPGSYTTTGEQWIDGYQLVPCGLMAPPQLIVRR